jgi:hypothetical protein
VKTAVLTVWLAFLAPVLHAEPPGAELISVKKIWDSAPHNGFTDLVRFHDQFFCCFREGSDHVGGDGVIRILSSRDGDTWEDCAGITEQGVDLREPKITVTADGRQLYLLCGGSIYEGGHTLKARRTRYATSSDGKEWTAPRPLLGEGDWLWRVALNPADKKFYGMADNIFPTTGGPKPEEEWSLKLYTGEGDEWQPLATLPVTGQPNQPTVRFLRDGRALVLVRRNKEDQGGIIGAAQAPYREWQWTKTAMRISSPNFIELPDGKLVFGIAPLRKEGGRQSPAARDDDGDKPGAAARAAQQRQRRWLCRSRVARRSALGQLQLVARR